jgi:hypothetical protein
MKNITKADIEAIATTEAAIEYRSIRDKQVREGFAQSMIMDLIQIQCYTELNYYPLELVVEMLEDALDDAYAAHIHETEMKPLIKAHDAKQSA